MNYSLTHTEVKTAKPTVEGKPRKLSDGGGLHLHISAKGAKSWRYKYRLGGKEYLHTLGLYPQVGLADARARHGKAHALVQQGLHPLVQQKADKLQTMLDAEDTFQALATAWIDSKKSGWTPYYGNQIKTVFEDDVYPHIGGLPIKNVTASHILAILKKVESRGAPVVAINAKQWCSQVFRFAVVNLKAENDPTAVLKGVIVRPKVKHNVALTPEQLANLLTQLSKFGGYRTTAIAIELLLLTFVRTVELRKATWSEFDLDERVWRIPAERMKMKTAHVVPLPKQAIKFLNELQGISGSMPHLFPNYRRPNDYMSSTTINQALKRVGFSGKGTIGFSAHGFRGTASTILYEKNYRTEAIEKQLAHAEKNQVKASYNQAQYLIERVKMMQDWADYVDTLRT
jgi:integrase